ncbi:glycine-rich domain-containing protein [Streptomyces microflavus]|uniref:glycine-rich domain-containing protein n=1 Tax=Streptomyces microflavus TaxID=1919 RepID=UPI0037F38C23
MLGNGSANDPFRISVDLEELLRPGPGIEWDPSSGTISVRLSEDASNAAMWGTDDGIFVWGGGGEGGPIAICEDYMTINGDGKLCVIPGMMGLRQISYFRTPGAASFVKASYPWAVRARVRVQAGGGGSGGADSDAGGSIPRPGGSGGGYSESIFLVSSLAASVPITVGAGGTAGVGNNPGGDGGASSFGTLVTAIGGNGGAANTTSGATNVTANSTVGPALGVGQLALSGSPGGGAIRVSASQGLAGAGGDSQLGTGGYGRSTTGPGGGTRGYGGGAGGAFSYNGPNEAGGVGGPGIVIVELYG